MYDLTPFHTFHIPAKARQIIEIHSPAQWREAWQRATDEHLPVLILGQGSNVLFLEDFNGVVLINRLQGITHREDLEFHYLHVQGGENWHTLVEWSLSQGIGGLENLALIPGCVGSAPIQNIGAYGIEFERFCEFVEVMNLNSGEIFRLTRAECEFGYRESIFKHRYSHGYVILSVGLKLPKQWQAVLNYGTLANFDPQTVSPQQIFDEVCAVRRAKLPDPNEFGNAGSFFKNPVIDFATFSAIQTAYPNVPHYPQADNQIKLPAGWLIDQCGLKGFRLNGAGVHTQQALVLINHSHASGADIVALAREVRRQVREKFAVEIHPEVRFIGANGEIDSEQATR